MEIKYYLRIENNSPVFLLKDLHQIKKTDIEVTDGEHEEFMNLQSEGKQFRVKETPTGNGLFDYLEEYTPEVIIDSTPTDKERIKALEKAMLEVL